MKIYHYRTLGMILLFAAAGVASWDIAFSQTKRSDDPIARSLYKRTLAAERNVNVAARVSTIHWGEAEEKSVFDLLEGAASEYRMVYRAPASVAGRTLVYDGKTLHQYEPSRNLIMRRLVPTPPAPTNESAQYVKQSVFSRGKEKITIAGRPVTVVNRHYVKTGILRERRWIDNKTYRTLQREQYDDNGKITRRVRYETVAFEPKAPASSFVPRFPSTARVLQIDKERKENAEQIARQVSLPLKANGYAIQSAVLVPNPAEQQLLYGDGVRSISVFVSVDEIDGTSLQPGNGWQLSKDDKDLLVRNDPQTERTAVAWVHEGRRYVAVGRMPIGALLTFVRAMQPGTSSL